MRLLLIVTLSALVLLDPGHLAGAAGQEGQARGQVKVKKIEAIAFKKVPYQCYDGGNWLFPSKVFRNLNLTSKKLGKVDFGNKCFRLFSTKSPMTHEEASKICKLYSARMPQIPVEIIGNKEEARLKYAIPLARFLEKGEFFPTDCIKWDVGDKKIKFGIRKEGPYCDPLFKGSVETATSKFVGVTDEGDFSLFEDKTWNVLCEQEADIAPGDTYFVCKDGFVLRYHKAKPLCYHVSRLRQEDKIMSNMLTTGEAKCRGVGATLFSPKMEEEVAFVGALLFHASYNKRREPEAATTLFKYESNSMGFYKKLGKDKSTDGKGKCVKLKLFRKKPDAAAPDPDYLLSVDAVDESSDRSYTVIEKTDCGGIDIQYLICTTEALDIRNKMQGFPREYIQAERGVPLKEPNDDPEPVGTIESWSKKYGEGEKPAGASDANRNSCVNIVVLFLIPFLLLYL